MLEKCQKINAHDNFHGLFCDEPDQFRVILIVLRAGKPVCRVETFKIAFIGQLWKDIQKMPDGKNVNLIVTADHRMDHNSNERIINFAHYLDKSWYKNVTMGFPTMIYTNKGCENKILKALSKVPHIRAWRKSEMPAYLNYGTNENIADIVVTTDIGWVPSDKDDGLSWKSWF